MVYHYTMTNITISISEEKLAELETVASNMGIKPEALLLSIIDKIITAEDRTVDAIVDEILEKDDELLRRLA